MRSIINISLPSELEKSVERLMKEGHYASKSEFLRELIRERLGEEDLLKQIKKNLYEIKAVCDVKKK